MTGIGVQGIKALRQAIRHHLKTAGRVRVELPAELEEKLLEAFRGWRET